MLCVSVDFRLWSVCDLMCVSLSECSLALEFFGQVVKIANSFSRFGKFLVERKATSVVAYVYWSFTRGSVTMCVPKLASVLRRLDVVSAARGWRNLFHAESSGLRFQCL